MAAHVELGQQEYEQYIARNASWNFWANLLDLTFYNLAMSFIFGATVLTLYASYLTELAVLIGLVPTVQNLGFNLPQLLLLRQAEQHPHKKTLVLRLTLFERLPYFWLGLLILWVPQMPRGLGYGLLIFSLFIWWDAGTGLEGHAFKDGARAPQRHHVRSEQRLRQRAGPWGSPGFAAVAGQLRLSTLLCLQLFTLFRQPAAFLSVLYAKSRAGQDACARAHGGQEILAAVAAGHSAQRQLPALSLRAGAGHSGHHGHGALYGLGQATLWRA